jgi:hypothetical protein
MEVPTTTVAITALVESLIEVVMEGLALLTV